MDSIKRLQKLLPHRLLSGRYSLVRQLGVGGFGQTFLAKDTQLPGQPLCVVKQLKPQIKTGTRWDIAKRLFDTEAEVLYQLGNHDQIPRLLAHFEDSQEFYLVQEFIEGEALDKALLPNYLWAETQVIRWVQDILGILAFVHQQHVIHRDIKPANLIRRKHDNKLVLIDFGAVKQVSIALGDSLSDQAMTIAIGTQGYMPPEQISGNPRFSSDLYAVGMIGIQALTGIRPDRLQRDIQTGEIRWRDAATSVHPELVDILDQLVRYHFMARYQTVEEPLQAINTLLQSDPTYWAEAVEPEPEPESLASTIVWESDSVSNQDAIPAPGELSQGAESAPFPTTFPQASLPPIETGLAATDEQHPQPIHPQPIDQVVDRVPDRAANSIIDLKIDPAQAQEANPSTAVEAIVDPTGVRDRTVISDRPREESLSQSINQVIHQSNGGDHPLPLTAILTRLGSGVLSHTTGLVPHLTPWMLLLAVAGVIASAVMLSRSPTFQVQSSATPTLPTLPTLPCREPPPPTLPSTKPSYEYADGTRYYGLIKNGRPADGRATMVFANGNRYDGEFQDGRRNGCGTYSFANGRRYIGQFKMDQFDGLGIWLLGDGDRYVGAFKDNRCNGEGIFLFKDGAFKRGTWQNGELANGKLSCNR